jgi:hypothetical protein
MEVAVLSTPFQKGQRKLKSLKSRQKQRSFCSVNPNLRKSVTNSTPVSKITTDALKTKMIDVQ